MKTCKGCNETKDLKEFYVAKKNKNGSVLYKNFCKVCQVEKDKARYHSLPKEVKQKRSKENREKLGFEYFKNYKLQREYGISLSEYNILLDNQDNKCYICNNKFNDTSDTRVDHNHETGQVRKILCHNCNVLIGHSKENVQILHNAIKYIEEHN